SPTWPRPGTARLPNALSDELFEVRRNVGGLGAGRVDGQQPVVASVCQQAVEVAHGVRPRSVGLRRRLTLGDRHPEFDLDLSELRGRAGETDVRHGWVESVEATAPTFL